MSKKLAIFIIMGIGIERVYSSPVLIWQKKYHHYTAYDMVCDRNGNLFLTGISNDAIYTIKVSPQGQIIWQSSIDPSATLEVSFGLILDNLNNCIYATGYANFEENDLYLVKYDALSGDTFYTKHFNYYEPGGEVGRSIDLYEDGRKIVIVGHIREWQGILLPVYPVIYEIDADSGNCINTAYYSPYGADQVGFWGENGYVSILIMDLLLVV